MKYLFLIIRHLFPRRKWRLVETIQVYETSSSPMPNGHVFIMEDQFGNRRKVKT